MVQLIISLDPRTGNVSVTGPLGDQILCYGMIERARDIVQASAPPIAPPKPEPMVKPIHSLAIETLGKNKNGS